MALLKMERRTNNHPGVWPMSHSTIPENEPLLLVRFVAVESHDAMVENVCQISSKNANIADCLFSEV